MKIKFEELIKIDKDGTKTFNIFEREVDSCEDIGLKHAWEKIEQNEVYLTCPPTYPPPKRECINCGKMQQLATTQSEIKEWQDN